MSLRLDQPQYTIETIVDFLQNTFDTQAKTIAVTAVSGGIDSALSLTLLAHTLSPEHIFPVMLPYGDQSVTDSQAMIEFAGIPQQNWITINIKPMVDLMVEMQTIPPDDRVRLGNIMARVRMMFVYDIAKQKNALVCGTENKSEKHLGYFTRFGDEASDIEPIQHLYKTQVRQLAQYLELPTHIQTKAPSAGLWENQTDELELGFSYEVADQVLVQLVDEGRAPADITVEGVSPNTIQKVLEQVEHNAFKHEVPYILEKI
jgi:NAD+ synthase